jgi:nucleotidyltransferase AbiEii toxin of type IV toxin-antitoxin system
VRSEVLPEPTRRLLEKFQKEDLPSKSYLAGGTAIALWLGHRKSVDLDWFTPHEFDEKQWQMKWETKWGFILRQRDWQTLTGEIDGVKTALYYYKYPLIEETTVYNGVEIAGLKDLAAMKMDAIISRGVKRDFIDLYFLIQKFGPNKMFEYYTYKYGHLNERELMIRKALIYFVEADDDEMPNMLMPVDWKEIRAFFIKTFV